VTDRRVSVRLSEDVYVELVRRFGVRHLSRGVEMLLREALSKPAERPQPSPPPPPEPPPKLEEPPATENQLELIAKILDRNRWNWLDIKDVLEYQLTAPLPSEPEGLTRSLASRVIDALLSWEKKPSKEELERARKLMEAMPEDYLKRFNLPERASDAKRYHTVLVEYAWAKLELEKAKKGGEAERGGG
jgi:hypothetical protein